MSALDPMMAEYLSYVSLGSVAELREKLALLQLYQRECGTVEEIRQAKECMTALRRVNAKREQLY